ncbi:MAG TPA: energy transducer TonB [Opitutaceae bacterium]|nr:energy transducer TonB [Opitutaceae bacterium]
MVIRFKFLVLLGSLILIGCATSPSTVPKSRSTSDSKAELHPVQNPIPPTPAGVFDISRVHVLPITDHRPPASYPLALRKAGVSGEATILFIVTPDGGVAGTMIVKASDIQFGEAARDAVAQWRFSPALVAGQPVYCRIMVPIVFTLGGN